MKNKCLVRHCDTYRLGDIVSPCPFCIKPLPPSFLCLTHLPEHMDDVHPDLNLSDFNDLDMRGGHAYGKQRAFIRLSLKLQAQRLTATALKQIEEIPQPLAHDPNANKTPEQLAAEIEGKPTSKKPKKRSKTLYKAPLPTSKTSKSSRVGVAGSSSSSEITPQ